MGSQFVDFNADGKIDLFTATFDGSPHVALGVEGGGFAEPHRILDKNGKRILLGQFWDYDAKTWSDTNSGKGHCTSAVAFDWDADGDLDILLGDYDHGNLYLCENEGTAKEPSFSDESIPVHAGGKPFGLKGGMTAPRLVDWDGDGLTDIVAGSFGDAYSGNPPGGVYWFRNQGKEGAPEFAAAVTLIAPTRTKGHEADRPNAGLYADPVDYDGDGDLDLVVGGYSIWKPEPPKLSAVDEARATKLKAEIDAASASMEALQERLSEETKDMDDEARSAAFQQLWKSEEFKRVAEKQSEMRAKYAKLKPGQQREAGVWVYLRK